MLILLVLLLLVAVLEQQRMMESFVRNLFWGQKNKPTYGGDNKGVTLGNSLPSVKPVKSATYDEGKAVVQAIESIAPSQTNKTYVQAALKEGGYNAGISGN